MRIVILSLFTVVFSVAIQAQSKDITSKINEVQVYIQGAEVTRQAKVSLTPGQNSLSLKGLSGGIDPNSIQISGLSGAKISYVNLERDYLSEVAIPPNIKPLLEDYEETQFNLEIRKRVKTAYDEERKLLLANQQVLGAQSNLEVEDLVKLADLYRSRLKEIELKTLEISRESKDLEQEIKKLANQLGSWKNVPNNSQNSLEIGLNSSTTQSITLEIKYLVYGAKWNPTYDIVAKEDQSKINLIYKASVSQTTGINWDNVDLSFSTGSPMRNGNLPQLYPDYVQILREAQIRGARANMKMDAMEMAEVAVAESADFAYTQQENGNVNTYFKTTNKHSIPSFGKAISVALSELNLPADYQYIAVPKVSKDAFLRAQISGYESAGLLPGAANMYFKGSLTGTSYLNPNQGEEKLDISLGRDPQIAVERKAVNDISKSGNIISSNKKSFHYAISIKNNKERSITIQVIDQIPISKNAEVQVVLEESSGASLNNETGEVKWNLEIPSGASQELILKYYIKFPKGERINR